MMRGLRLGCISVALALTPLTAFAQAGVTPLLTGPVPLVRRSTEFRGYVTLEEEIDLLGVYRRGIGQSFDFGIRAGYSDVGDGAFHLGGDLRYGLPWETESELRFALAGGLQFTFAHRGNLIAVPFGISIGADVGAGERAVILYGLPHLTVERWDPDGPGSDTELEFGVEMGSQIELTRVLDFSGALTVATNDDDHIELALGLIYRR
jgi:hypothetical protein